MRCRALLVAVLLATARAAAAAASGPAQVVVDFNNVAQEAVRSVGAPNQLSSKIYALVHLAQYQAVAPKASSTSQDWQATAAAYAAHTVLDLLFPWRYARFDDVLKKWTSPGLSADQAASAKEAGRSAGLKVVASSLDDGFDAYVPFSPAPANGPVAAYQYVPGQTSALYPQLKSTRAFVLSNATKYSAEPLKIPSEEYTKDLKEVFELGGQNSAKRTKAQTDTANFWVDGNTTSSVSGQWNTAAQQVLPSNATVAEAAELFARLNTAIWDASIAGWNIKYSVLFWRPITAIRQGDGSTQNAAIKDAGWNSYLATPNHPEFPSGHSLTSGAAVGVLSSYFGDNTTFVLPTEFPGLAPRTYTSFSQALDDVNDSRVFGGVHFRHAVDIGGSIGRSIGETVFDQFPTVFGQPQGGSTNAPISAKAG